jgi:putative ABC transport system permease protein
VAAGLDPRWRKVLRDLMTHKLRTLLVVLSIAVGIFAILVVMGGRGILLDTFGANFPKSNPSTAVLYTSGFDPSMIDRVRRFPGVRDADGRRIVTMRYRTGDVTALVEPPVQVTQAERTKAIELASAEEWATSRLEVVFPEPGTLWPPPRGEVVLETSDKQVVGTLKGDLITVDTADGGKRLLRVAGFAHDINSFPAMFVGHIRGYVSVETMADLGAPKEMSALLVALDTTGLDRAGATRVISKIRDDLVEPTGVRVLGTYVPEVGSHRLGDIFKAVSVLLLALGVLALVLSAFLVVNTVTALLTQQVRQLGIMKAVGGTSWQIMRMYLVLVAIYGAMALMIGLPVGIYWASWFSVFAGGLLNFGPGSTTPPLYAIELAVAVGFVVPIAAAYVPVHAGTRMSVVTALNATGMSGSHFGHGPLDRLLGKIRGLPRPVALALRNTFLRKGRLAMTLATLVLASAVVMSVGSVRASILATVADMSSWWRYDSQITFVQPVSARLAEREAAKVTGVTGSEGWIVASASLKRGDGTENDTLSVIGLPPATTFITPQIVEGRWLEAGERGGVVVNTDVVKDEHLAVGDSVSLKVRGVECVFTIVGIARGQMMGPVFFADVDHLDARLSLSGSITRLMVRTSSHSMADQDATGDRLERRFTDLGLLVAGVQGQARMSDAFASQLGILVTFLVIMAVILATVGVIGLIGTMIINVLESTREIGVMRAVGASHGSIFRVFVTEGFVIGVLSWAGGVVLSFPMSWALVQLLQTAIGVPLTYSFSWPTVGLWLVVVSAISSAASLLPAYRASQVSVRDAIAYE